MSRLLNGTVDLGDHQEDNHGQKGCEKRGERILETTVLGDLDNLGDDPTDEIHPRHGGREGETTDDGVEGLGLEFLGDEIDSLEGRANGGHFI